MHHRLLALGALTFLGACPEPDALTGEQYADIVAHADIGVIGCPPEDPDCECVVAATECAHKPCERAVACEESRCVYEPEPDCQTCTAPAECPDDGDACTVESCVAHECEREERDCDDDRACTIDTCDPASGCAHEDTCPAPTIDLPTELTVDEGLFQYTGSYSGATLDGDEMSASVDWGDGSPPGTLLELDQPNHRIDLDHVYAEPGSYQISVRLTDGDDRRTTHPIALTVKNLAPVVTFDDGLPDAIDEGSDFAVAGAVADPGGNLSLSGTVDFGDSSAVAPLVITTGSIVSDPLTHRYANDGIYSVTMTVTDTQGLSTQETYTLPVRNVAPRLSDPGTVELFEGTPKTLRLALIEPGDDAIVGTVNIGTESVPFEVEIGENDKSLVLTLSYPNDGNQNVTYNLRDDDAAPLIDSFAVKVLNVPPAVDPHDALEGDEGTPIEAEVTFADPGRDELEWEAEVDYGDGSPITSAPLDPETKTVTLRHPYADDGPYLVKVWVSDAIASDMQTIDVTIGNVPPLPNLGADDTVAEGSPWTRARTATDAGADQLTGRVSYAGASSVVLPVGANGAYALAHTFPQDGVFPVAVTITDDEGGNRTDTIAVTVTNVAPSVECGALVDNVAEGSTFARSCTVSDAGADALSATVDYGAGPEAVGIVNGKVSLSHAFGDEGFYDVTLTVADDDTETTRTIIVGVGDVPPLVHAGGDATLSEGGAFAQDGSVSTAVEGDSVTATVDYGDGSGASPLAIDDGVFALAHTYAQDGHFVVTVTVEDGDGDKGTDTVDVVVGNVAPTIALGVAVDLDEGQTFQRLVPVSDPGVDDTIVATIDDGRGGSPTQVVVPADRVLPLAIVYPQEGSYTLKVSVADEDGAMRESAIIVTVHNVKPQLAALAEGTVLEGASVTRTLSVTDPGADTFVATVDWDDGTLPQVVPLTGAGGDISHTYADNGVYGVIVSLSDGTENEVIGFTVTVNNAAPVITTGTIAPAFEGSVWTYRGTLADAGAADTFSGKWRPVNSGAYTTFAVTPGQFQIANTYTDDGTFTFQVEVADDDGGSATASASAVIQNVAPAFELGADVTLDEGQSLTRAVTFTDPGADAWLADVTYGDGGSQLDRSVTKQVPFNVTHTYRDEGNFQLSLSIADDVDTTTDTATVTVRNLAPSVSMGGPVTLAEGATLTRGGTVSDAGLDDVISATVDWGEGLGPQPLTVSARAFTLSHAYTGNGVFTVTVVASDDSGATGQASFNVTVSNSAPAVDAGVAALIVEGSALLRDVTFSDSGADDWSATVDWGEGKPVENVTVDDANKKLTLNHTYRQDGRFTVTVSVFDGNETGQGSFVLDVQNTLPVVDIGADGSVAEGSHFIRAGSYTDPGPDDPHNASVTWGDGASGSLSLSGQGGFSLDHVYADDGIYTLEASVGDDDGQGKKQIAVTVTNVAPTVADLSAVSRQAGQLMTRNATFTDPGVLDTFTALVDYGESTPVALTAVTSPIALSHTYDVPGTYTVTVTVTDDDGGSGQKSFQVTVANTAPVLTAGSDVSVNEGSAATVTATYTDAGINTHTGSVRWTPTGSFEAATVVAAQRQVRGTHTYSTEGSYAVVLRVTDQGGLSSDATVNVNVANVAPVVSAGSDTTLTEGSTLSRTVTFTDPGTDPWTAIIDWGEGGADEPVTVDAVNRTVALSHQFPENGTFVVTVTIDDGTTSREDSFLVDVGNATPVVSVGADLTVDEGLLWNRTVSFTDAGPNDVHTGSVTWGDGQTGTLTIDNRQFTLSHAYADNGTFTVKATINDGVASGSDELIATVRNVAPIVNGPNAASTDAGSTVSGSYTIVDPGTDTFTAVVDYGDGTIVTPTVSGTAVPYSHVYNVPGSYTLKVTVTDDDLGVGTKETAVTVLDVAPTVTAGQPVTVAEGSIATVIARYSDPGTNTHSGTIRFTAGGANETATIDAPTTTVSGTHTYSDNGTHSALVTVTDQGGLSGTATVNVTVTNVAPTFDAGLDVRAIPDRKVTRTITISDPGTDTFTATVDWGDGGGTQPVLVVGNSLSLSKTYAANGNYTVTVTVRDDDGGQTSDTFAVDARLFDCTGLDTTTASVWVGGTAGATTSWTTADNWLTRVVPGTTSTVTICSGPTSLPVLGVDATIAGLFCGEDVEMSVDNVRTLTVKGNVACDISGLGTLRMELDNASWRGLAPNFIAGKNTMVAGNSDILNQLQVVPGALLDINGMTVTVGGNAVINAGTNAGLALAHTHDVLAIEGNLTLSGQLSGGNLSAGKIYLGGTFSTVGTGLHFVSEGTSLTFDGASIQNILLTGTNSFADVIVDNPTTVTLSGTLGTTGTFTLKQGAFSGATSTDSLALYGGVLPVITSGSYLIPKTEIRSAIALGANTSFTNANHTLVVREDGQLDLENRTLTITGDFEVDIGGQANTGLVMDQASAQLEVKDDATFKTVAYLGGFENGNVLTAGKMTFRGDLITSMGDNATVYYGLYADGTSVLIDGTTGITQTLELDHAHFKDIELGGLRTFDMNGTWLRASGTLKKRSTGVLSIVDGSIATTDINAESISMTNGHFFIDDYKSTSFFQNITFGAPAAQAPVILQIQTANSALNATLSGISFTVQPNANQDYLWLVNAANTGTPKITMSNPSPKNGSSRTKVWESGKGTISWGTSTDDSDGDGLTDTADLAAGSNPVDEDTDNDGFWDGLEVGLGKSPTSATSTPVTLGTTRTITLPTSAAPTKCAVGNVDSDGQREVVVANTGSTTAVSIVNVATDGTLSKIDVARVNGNAFGVALGNMAGPQGDSQLEIMMLDVPGMRPLMAEYNSTTQTWTQGNGPVIGADPTDIITFNKDATGADEAVIVHGATPGYTVMTMGTGTPPSAPTTVFTALTGTPKWVRVGNMDATGGMDVVIAGTGNAKSVVTILSNTNGTLGNFTTRDFTTEIKGLAVGDIDKDTTDEDIAVVVENTTTGIDSLYIDLRSSGTSYTRVGPLSVPDGARSVSIGDVDGNGKPDVATASETDDSVTIYFQTTAGAWWSYTFDGVDSAGETFVVLDDLDFSGKADIITVNKTSNALAVTAQ